jgi:phosphoribosylformylglycinamidine synthase
MHFSQAGRTIVLLRANNVGDAVDAELEFGSSEYAKEVLGAVWGYPPELNIEKEATLQRAIIAIIQAGLAESAHDCADGGLAVALVECGLPAGIGLRVKLSGYGLPPEFRLFGEDASRVVLSCDPAHLARIKQVAEDFGVKADVLGETGGERAEITIDGLPAVSARIEELRGAYEGALEKALRSEAGIESEENN